MNENNVTFEQSLMRLEQIVRALEHGDVPLEESLKLFQEGTGLVRSCQKLLDDAKLQVQKVMADANGEPVLEDLDNESIIG
jgi:exodeoxyribonuclease VII small subunit